jgi:hypothetical protein
VLRAETYLRQLADLVAAGSSGQVQARLPLRWT